MAMRETVRSLRLYFILSGLAGGATNLVGVLGDQPAIARIFAFVGVGCGVAYLFVGFRLRHFLVTAPQQVLALLLAGAVFLAGLFGLAALFGEAGRTLPMVILGLLITWYLYVNVRRLAAESQVKPAESVS